MLKKLIKVAGGLLLVYLSSLAVLYYAQHMILFRPYQLEADYQFRFPRAFEEVNLTAQDGTNIHHVFFPAEDSKGVVLYYHGNGGTVREWGNRAGLFTMNGYDVLFQDYRSYGKSGGKIESEEQILADAQLAYDYLKERYSEEDIILCGTSMGTGVATQIAGKNEPARLILNCPYSSLDRLVREKVPVIPSALIRFKMHTEENILAVKCPIHIFHGSKDRLIPHRHSLRLKEIAPRAELQVLEGCGHRIGNMRPDYKAGMASILL